MELIVSGRHLPITDAIRQHASEKVSKLPRFFDRIQKVEVIVDKKDHNYECEVIVHVDHNDPFISRVNGQDLYACMDEATHKLERRLADHKEKLRNRKHNT